MPVRLQHREIFDRDSSFFIANTVFSIDRPTRPHTHDFYELFIIRRGGLLHSLNNEIRLVPENSICFIKPSDSHGFKKEPGSHFTLMTNIAFTPGLFRQVMQFLFGDNWQSEVELLPDPKEITTDMESLLKELIGLMFMEDRQSSYFVHEAKVKSLLSSLFIDLATPVADKLKQLPPWLSAAMKAMEIPENYEQGLKRFIQLSGKSQEHLTRSMQGFCEITPTRFINQLRIQRCAYLLQSTTKEITRISYESGFNNISHFNKVFKSHYSCSPREFRKRNQLSLI